MLQRKILATASCSLGAMLLLGYGATLGWNEMSRERGVRALDAPTEALPTPRPLSFHGADQSLWSPQRIRAFAASRMHADAPTAVLRIPSVGLEVPVYDGTSEINLNRGAGQVEGTAPIGSAGNVVLAGHRDGFFRKLKDVRAGQPLFLDTRSTRTGYRIRSMEIVEPTQVSVLAPTTRPVVTLVTCYPFYFVGPAPKRFIVRAEIDSALLSPTRRGRLTEE